MNKKILSLNILAVSMLVTISFASAINTNTTINVQKKESPLYGIRTKLAIGEKISDIIKNIRTKFLGERIFFLPIQRLSKISNLRFCCCDMTSPTYACSKI